MVLLVVFVYLMKQGTFTNLSQCSSTKCTIPGRQLNKIDCSTGCFELTRLSFTTKYELQRCLPLCQVNAYQVTSTSPCEGALFCSDGNDAYTVTSTCELADGIGFDTCNLGDTKTDKIPCERAVGLPKCGVLIVPGGKTCAEFDPFFYATTDLMNANSYGQLMSQGFPAVCSTQYCATAQCMKTVHTVGVPNDLGPVNSHISLFGTETVLELHHDKFITAHPDGSLSQTDTIEDGSSFVIINYQAPVGGIVTGQMVAFKIDNRPTYNFNMSSNNDLFIAGWIAAFVLK